MDRSILSACFTAVALAPLPLLLLGCDDGADPPAFDGVTMQIVDTYRLADGTEVKHNASQEGETRTILTDLGPTGKSFDAKLSADGTKLEFAGVPTGAYWIVTASERTTEPPFPVPDFKFYRRIASARSIDDGAIYAGREDLVSVTKETIASVVAPSLAIPWQQYTEDDQGNVTQPHQDSVEVYARNADAQAYATPFDPEDPKLPVDQATTFDGWTFDWSASVYGASRDGTVLPLLAASDEAILTHLVTTTIVDPAVDPADSWSSFDLEVAADAGTLAPVTMADGSGVTLEATLTAGPEKTFALDYRGSAFVSEVTANGPSILSRSYVFLNAAREPGAPLPIYGNAPTLFDGFVYSADLPNDPVCYPDGAGMCDPVACAAGCDDSVTIHHPGDHTASLAYRDPHEAHGQALFSASFNFRTIVVHPKSGASVRLPGNLSVSRPIADASGQPIVPILGLPRTLTIGGKAATVDVTTMGAGTSPTVAWSAPSLGTAKSYFVRVMQWSDTETADESAVSVSIAAFRTADTTVQIPEGLLASGVWYSVQIRADDWSDETKPNLYTTSTLGGSEVSTGLFTP